MPQELGSRVIYPEEMQDAIASANAKLSVLRDETARLEEQKAFAHKDLAKLELKQDETSSHIDRFIQEADVCEARFKDASERMEVALRELEVTLSDKKVAEREISEIRAEIAVESSRLSSISEDQRRIQEDMKIEQEAHKKMKELFESRKARVIELLSSI